ncbi:unnamed protein product, partial [Ixodes pacificus]
EQALPAFLSTSSSFSEPNVESTKTRLLGKSISTLESRIPSSFPSTRCTAPEQPSQVISTSNSCTCVIKHHNSS